jgi:hypothetical protein
LTSPVFKNTDEIRPAVKVVFDILKQAHGAGARPAIFGRLEHRVKIVIRHQFGAAETQDIGMNTASLNRMR